MSPECLCLLDHVSADASNLGNASLISASFPPTLYPTTLIQNVHGCGIDIMPISSGSSRSSKQSSTPPGTPTRSRTLRRRLNKKLDELGKEAEEFSVRLKKRVRPG